jgi:hypothetical protein
MGREMKGNPFDVEVRTHWFLNYAARSTSKIELSN